MSTSADDERAPGQRFGEQLRAQMVERRSAMSPPLSPRQRDQREQRDAERRAAEEHERDDRAG